MNVRTRKVRTRSPGTGKHPRAPQPKASVDRWAPASTQRGAARGGATWSSALRVAEVLGRERERERGAGDALSHARPVLGGLKMAAAAGARSRRRGREKESL